MIYNVEVKFRYEGLKKFWTGLYIASPKSDKTPHQIKQEIDAYVREAMKKGNRKNKWFDLEKLETEITYRKSDVDFLMKGKE